MNNFGTMLRLTLNPLSTNPTKWSNTLKQFTSYAFDHFVGLALIGLKNTMLTKIKCNALLLMIENIFN